jgi:hypothetical protein
MCEPFITKVVAEQGHRNSDESIALCDSELIVSVCDKLLAHASRVTLRRDVHSTRIDTKLGDSL